MFDHVDHFGGQVPAFAGLVAQARNVLGARDHLFDGPVRLELAVRGRKGAVHGLLVLLERPEHDRHDVALLAVDTQVLLVPRGGGHGVVEELHEAGQFGLAALGLDDVDGVVVGVGVELHEDLADEADARLARDVAQGQGVEGAHALADDLPVGDAPAEGRHASRRDPLLHVGVPRAVQLHRGAGRGLVGAHAQ